METIYLIMPGKISDSFAEIVKIATENCQLTIVKATEDLPALKNKKIIFAIELDECGFNIPLFLNLNLSVDLAIPVFSLTSGILKPEAYNLYSFITLNIV